MSRSNPTEASRNPSTRWFEWSGGADGGFVRWYDKEAKKHVTVEGPFVFLLLDELATVKGWHEPSESAILANEVRDTRQEVFVVRSFEGGELASGLYASIRDRIVALGGHFCVSLYLAYKDGDQLKIGNLSLKGAALSAWMDFKKNAGTKKDASGKSMRAYFVDAVKIAGYEQQKKGGTVYRVPKFSLMPVSDATNQQAVALDVELQAFLTDYFKRPKAEAVKAPSEPTQEPSRALAEMPDDLPWQDENKYEKVTEEVPF